MKYKKKELEEVLGRAVGKGVSAGENLGAYTNANGQTTTVRPEFAGQTVQMGNKYITYDDRGSPTKAINTDWAKQLGNDYTSQNMGLDQQNIANGADIYRALYNQGMNSGTNATGNLANAFGKRNIQYDATLGRSDYESLIQNAAAKGNNVLAGYYEDSLNALLNNLGMGNQMTSNYNGGWNYVDNGGGVGNIYAGAMADPNNPTMALGGGWNIGQGLGNAEGERFYANNDMPSMQEVLAYAKMLGYDTEDENVTIPVGDLSRQMIASGYVAPGTQKTADTLGVALPAVLQNLGMEAGDNLGTNALTNAIASMRQGTGGAQISDENLANLYNMAAAATAADAPMSRASAYGGNYGGGRAQDIANQILGMNYNDWTQGSEYASLADRYSDQGRAAMQNTLGQISSRTGGLASSYATTAAQQQYNEYISMLEEVARQMYDNDRSDMMDNFNMMRTLENDEYARQQDALARQQAAQDDAFSRQMAAAELMAGIGDFSGYKALGLTDDQIAALGANYAAQNQPKVIYRTVDPGDGGGDEPVKPTYDYWLGTGESSGGKASLSYDQDEGIFTWNGKNYSRLQDVANAIDNDRPSEEEAKELEKKFALYGFDIKIT